MEHTVYPHDRLALRRKGSIHTIRTERDFWIAVALKNFPIHFAIPHAVAADTAPGIHHNFASQLARSMIKPERASFQLETSVNRVQDIAKRKVDGRVLRVGL